MRGTGDRVSRAIENEPLQKAMARLRETVPALKEDRYLAPDLNAAAQLIRDGALVGAAGLALNMGDA